ncbi:MAG: uridine kinase [Armatimonadetes bacterium]|nr:uridine kinase [Armatimonadota bacterium]
MRAFVIGIGGGSASGKSTIAETLSRKLSPLQVRVINQDRYFHGAARLPEHANRAGTRSWPDHNHPDSLDFPRLRRDLATAREGDDEVIIVEGILVLHDAELRGLMDLKVFVDADADERIVRRIRRNLAAGYELDGICDFYVDSVRYRHREFCEPTRAHADVVVPGGQDERDEAERALDEVCGRVRAARGGVVDRAGREQPTT